MGHWNANIYMYISIHEHEKMFFSITMYRFLIIYENVLIWHKFIKMGKLVFKNSFSKFVHVLKHVTFIINTTCGIDILFIKSFALLKMINNHICVLQIKLCKVYILPKKSNKEECKLIFYLKN